MGEGASILTGAGVAAALVALLKAADWLLDRQQKIRSDAQAELRAVLDQTTATVREQGAKMDEMEADHRRREDECRERLGRAERAAERALSHVTYLEDVLIEKGVRFRRFSPDPSGHHNPLPPANPGGGA